MLRLCKLYATTVLESISALLLFPMCTEPIFSFPRAPAASTSSALTILCNRQRRFRRGKHPACFVGWRLGAGLSTWHAGLEFRQVSFPLLIATGCISESPKSAHVPSRLNLSVVRGLHSVVMDHSGKRFCKEHDAANGWGAQGWFPATYAVPVEELALWRGKLLRLEEPAPDGTIAVHDMGSGNLFFAGPPNSFDVRWL